MANEPLCYQRSGPPLPAGWTSGGRNDQDSPVVMAVFVDPAIPEQAPDPLLREFLEATDERRSRDLLGGLLMSAASPIVWRVIRSRLLGVERATQEDVHAQSLLRLTRLLSAQRTGAAPIEDFGAYVAAVATNACREHLRACYPARTRLARQVRYLLAHGAGLALWQAPGGSWIGGLARWAGQAPPAQAGDALREVAANASRLLPGRDPALVRLGDVTRALLSAIGGPVPLDPLIEVLALIRGVHDEPAQPIAEDHRFQSASAGASSEDRLADAQYLLRLWAEIEALPRRQRVALLLNLRDAAGRDILRLLPTTGVADLRRIARALELPLAELESLLPALPRNDAWIADRLDLTRRQVINLRKCARERLARRLRGL